MKAEKVRELDGNELRNQVRDSEEQLFRLKFQMSLGQADGLKKYRLVRKDRARMLTVLREREVNPKGNPEPEKSVQVTEKSSPASRMRGFFKRAKKGNK
jgi:large subunit ribosomal protein L29